MDKEIRSVVDEINESVSNIHKWYENAKKEFPDSSDFDFLGDYEEAVDDWFVKWFGEPILENKTVVSGMLAGNTGFDFIHQKNDCCHEDTILISVKCEEHDVKKWFQVPKSLTEFIFKHKDKIILTLKK